jgi:hypothetical protein
MTPSMMNVTRPGAAGVTIAVKVTAWLEIYGFSEAKRLINRAGLSDKHERGAKVIWLSQ